MAHVCNGSPIKAKAQFNPLRSTLWAPDGGARPHGWAHRIPEAGWRLDRLDWPSADPQAGIENNSEHNFSVLRCGSKDGKFTQDRAEFANLECQRPLFGALGGKGLKCVQN